MTENTLTQPQDLQTIPEAQSTEKKQKSRLRKAWDTLTSRKKETEKPVEYDEVSKELAEKGDFVGTYIKSINHGEQPITELKNSKLSENTQKYLSQYALQMGSVIEQNQQLYKDLASSRLLNADSEISTPDQQDGALVFEQLTNGEFPSGETYLKKYPWGGLLFIESSEDIRNFHGMYGKAHTYWKSHPAHIKVNGESHQLRYGVVTEFEPGTIGYRETPLENAVQHESGHGEYRACQNQQDIDYASKTGQTPYERSTLVVAMNAKDEFLQDLITSDTDEKYLKDPDKLMELHSPYDASGYGDTSRAGEILFYWNNYRNWFDTPEQYEQMKNDTKDILRKAINATDKLFKHKGGYTNENREWMRYFLWLHPIDKWPEAVETYLDQNK